MNKVKEVVELYHKITDLLPDGNISMTVHGVKEKNIPVGVSFEGILKDCGGCKIYSSKNKHNNFENVTFFITKEEI